MDLVKAINRSTVWIIIGIQVFRVSGKRKRGAITGKKQEFIFVADGWVMRIKAIKQGLKHIIGKFAPLLIESG